MAENIPKDVFRRITQEIVLAEKLNENELEPSLRTNIARYTGQFIPSVSGSQDWDIVLNEVYPIIQRELPSTFFRNPRVFLKPRNKTFIAKRRNPLTGAMENKELDSAKSAKTQEAILNYKLEEIRYKRETQKVLLDALLFPHGILWHGYKGNFGMTDERSMFIDDADVFVNRLSPLKFLKDPSVPMSNLEEAHWVGRSFEVTLDDLLADDQLDVDKSRIKGRLGYGEMVGNKQPGRLGVTGGQDRMNIGGVIKPLSEFLDKDYKNGPLARFVTLYEIFIRPTLKEKRDGGTGYVLLYTKEQEKPLRVNPWPYKAKGWPAIPLQFNPMNDDMFGLADPQIWGNIVDQKNAVINLQLRNAKENSKVWVGINKNELSSEEDIDKIRQGDQTIIVTNSDPGSAMKVMSAAGAASGELYMLDGRIQKNLENGSGVTELGMGRLQSGEESAKSVEIRSQNMSARPAYRQDIMSDFISDSVHFLNGLIKQYYPVDKAVRIVGSLDLEWSNDPSKEEIQAETDAEIDVVSMLPENPDKEIMEMNTILTMMYQAITTPAIMQKITEEGMVINVSPIIENLLMRLRVRDPDVYRHMKPEESQGYASVAELRAAGDNVHAALAGQPPPNPPAPGQDHRGRLEVYTNIQTVLKELGNTIAGQIVNQLIQTQTAIAQEEADKQPEVGKPIQMSSKMNGAIS